jgi:hypothetical protein
MSSYNCTLHMHLYYGDFADAMEFLTSTSCDDEKAKRELAYDNHGGSAEIEHEYDSEGYDSEGYEEPMNNVMRLAAAQGDYLPLEPSCSERLSGEEGLPMSTKRIALVGRLLCVLHVKLFLIPSISC